MRGRSNDPARGGLFPVEEARIILERWAHSKYAI